MKIFVDSARLDEIEKAYSYGITNGVTTNPSLIKKAVKKLQDDGKKTTMKDYIKKILITAKGNPVSLEVTETTSEGMIKQAKKIYKMFNSVANNVNIKIPINPSFKVEDDTHFDGIKTIQSLSKAGIPVNCTLIFTPEQALLAAKAGAKYVSPFAGRIDDFLRNKHEISFEKTDYFPFDGWEIEGCICEDKGVISGIDLIEQIIQIFLNYDFKTEVIAASLRNVQQVREAALVGADIATVPYNVIKDLLKHYKTFEGMKNFTKDIVPEYAELIK